MDWSFGYLVNRLAARMQADFEARLAPHQVTRLQWNVLRDLHDGPRQPARLAAGVGCDRAVMTRTLEVLERRGWVTREVSTADRRQIDVTLTKAGELLTRELIALSRAVNERFLSPVPKKQALELIQLLGNILAATQEPLPAVA